MSRDQEKMGFFYAKKVAFRQLNWLMQRHKKDKKGNISRGFSFAFLFFAGNKFSRLAHFLFNLRKEGKVVKLIGPATFLYVHWKKAIMVFHSLTENTEGKKEKKQQKHSEKHEKYGRKSRKN